MRPGDDRDLAHGQRAEAVDDAGGEVQREARAGLLRAVDGGDDEHAGYQELDVVDAGAGADDAAEDVVEEQQEEDAHDHREGQLLGHARGADEVAAGDGVDVADGLSDARGERGLDRRVGWTGDGGGHDWLLWADAPRCAGGLAGDLDEDVVERGATQLEVGHLHAGLLDPSQGSQAVGHSDTRRCRVRSSTAATRSAPMATAAASRPGGSRHGDLEHIAVQASLELGGGAGRDGRPRSMTTMWSASWSASSRYCVVSTTAAPSSRMARICSQRASASAGVEAGRGLVEEDGRRVGDERGHEVEPSPLPARERLCGAVRVLGHAEALDELVDAPRRRAPGRW